jgi:Fe-S-cluster-containing dehydrogenase component
MVINLDRCVGCDDCVRACATTHDNNPRFTRHGYAYENAMIVHACMHCTDPVCLIGCPTGAIHREQDSGTVVINDDTCIGCGTCANSCPYNNIKMVNIRDQMGAFVLDRDGQPVSRATKCDLCASQLTGPACQEACPHDALIRVNIRDTKKLLAWLG